MGENVYSFVTSDLETFRISFSEMDEDFGCLCTFPHNDQEQLSIERLISLAMFGAAVRLAFENKFNPGYIYLPESLPSWLVKEFTRYKDTIDEDYAEYLTDEIRKLQEKLREAYAPNRSCSMAFRPDICNYTCSQCNFNFYWPRENHPKYCPDCGRKVICVVQLGDKK